MSNTVKSVENNFIDLIKSNEFASAVNVFEENSEILSSSVLIKEKYAFSLFKISNYEKSINFYKELQRDHPKNPDVWNGMVHPCLAANSLDEFKTAASKIETEYINYKYSAGVLFKYWSAVSRKKDIREIIKLFIRQIKTKYHSDELIVNVAKFIIDHGLCGIGEKFLLKYSHNIKVDTFIVLINLFKNKNKKIDENISSDVFLVYNNIKKIGFLQRSDIANIISQLSREQLFDLGMLELNAFRGIESLKVIRELLYLGIDIPHLYIIETVVKYPCNSDILLVLLDCVRSNFAFSIWRWCRKNLSVYSDLAIYRISRLLMAEGLWNLHDRSLKLLKKTGSPLLFSCTRKKPKVAVLVSGQLRQFEAAASSVKVFLKNCDPTFFVSCWRDRGGKTGGAMNIAQLKRILPPEFIDAIPPNLTRDGKLFSMFPEVYNALLERAHEPIANDYISRNYGESSFIEVEDEIVFESACKSDQYLKNTNYDINTLKMYYKIYKSLMLCVRSNEKFDYAIRIRPDLSITGAINFSNLPLSNNHLYVDNVWANGTGDQLAIGKFDDIEKYCNLWSFRDVYFNKATQSKYDSYYETHGLMACHLHRNDIRHQSIGRHGVSVKLVEEPRLKLNFDELVLRLK